MKILHIGKYFTPFAGGMETYLRDLMVEQSKQGLKPCALVHKSTPSLSSSDENYREGGAALPVTRCAMWLRLSFTPVSPGFLYQLKRLISREQPDILHIHMPNPSAFWALLLPSARRIPWVVHWHSDVLASRHSLGLRLFYALYQPFESAMLRHCARVIVASPPYLQSSKPLKPFHNKAAVVPLGITAPKGPAPARQTEHTHAGNLRVLAVGRLTYYKGFEFLIRAAALVKRVEVHLVGGGDLEKPLRELVEKFQLGDRVVLHGKLPDSQLIEQYQACDCLCLPSIERTEAFGVVLLEAMSYGKATIVSAVPGSGMGWVVDHQETGLLVEPGNAQALADALRILREDRDRIRQLGESGRRKFTRLFQIDSSAKRVASLYRAILAESVNP